MSRGAQAGFILPLTIAAVLVLSITLIPLFDGIGRAVDRVKRGRDRFDATLAREAATATAILSIVTQGTEPPEAVADGRIYAAGPALVSLRDLRGLTPIDGIGGAGLRRLLIALGVDPADAPALADAYFDYIDADDFARSGGSERDAYRDAGLPPPRNEPLATPGEARAILGWRERDALWRDQAWENATTLRGPGGFNPAVAPRAALMTLEGLTGDLADAIIAARGSAAELLPPSAKTDPRGVIQSPSGAARVTVAAGAGARRLEARTTAVDPARPWRIDWSVPVPLSSFGSPGTNDAPPEFPPLRAEPARR